MPELAEVEFFRRRWDPGLGQKILAVDTHPKARIFESNRAAELPALLKGNWLTRSEAHGKQILFHTRRGLWLGIHLGMSGQLRFDPPGTSKGKHDHLVLHTAVGSLVLSDPRMFGRVRWHQDARPPEWWTNLPPAILSRAFTLRRVTSFLHRHNRSPIKAVLLNQNGFPGIGNWMADEILWRSAIHPATPAGMLYPDEARLLWRVCRQVARDALRVIGGSWGTPPDTWLFNHRWRDGGICPRTGAPLRRAVIAGRTTCWSPARQIRRTLAASGMRK